MCVSPFPCQARLAYPRSTGRSTHGVRRRAGHHRPWCRAAAAAAAPSASSSESPSGSSIHAASSSKHRITPHPGRRRALDRRPAPKAAVGDARWAVRKPRKESHGWLPGWLADRDGRPAFNANLCTFTRTLSSDMGWRRPRRRRLPTLSWAASSTTRASNAGWAFVVDKGRRGGGRGGRRPGAAARTSCMQTTRERESPSMPRPAHSKPNDQVSSPLPSIHHIHTTTTYRRRRQQQHGALPVTLAQPRTAPRRQPLRALGQQPGGG